MTMTNCQDDVARQCLRELTETVQVILEELQDLREIVKVISMELPQEGQASVAEKLRELTQAKR
jgi:hypothetical protein